MKADKTDRHCEGCNKPIGSLCVCAEPGKPVTLAINGRHYVPTTCAPGEGVKMTRRNFFCGMLCFIGYKRANDGGACESGA